MMFSRKSSWKSTWVLNYQTELWVRTISEGKNDWVGWHLYNAYVSKRKRVGWILTDGIKCGIEGMISYRGLYLLTVNITWP